MPIWLAFLDLLCPCAKPLVRLLALCTECVNVLLCVELDGSWLSGVGLESLELGLQGGSTAPIKGPSVLLNESVLTIEDPVPQLSCEDIAKSSSESSRALY